ncbi:nitroreductase family protein [candidate division KSB1 bacterium]|nr:nitroreductase family protein [candidate division KSB1 bacterium]
MSVFELIYLRRSIRRFKQKAVDYELLKKFADAGRIAPSASNMQPLEFIIVDEPDTVDTIFDHTEWARLLPNKTGRPQAGQQPVAFIVILVNKDHETAWIGHDVGAASENIILTAMQYDVGTCWLASINRKKIASLLDVPENYRVDSVIALGYPDEHPVMEPIKDTTAYYRDETGRLHVPKRELYDILHRNIF